MNPQVVSMSYILKIAVIGAHTAIGSEVARYGVAVGYEVIGVTPNGEPPTDEPWIHGVTWQKPNTFDPQDSYGIVIVDADLVPQAIADLSTEVRTVSVGTPINPASVTVALDVAGVVVERAAMAALRCAVEDEREGSFDPDEVDYIGDAMMLQ